MIGSPKREVPSKAHELTELSNNIGNVNIGIKNKELFIEEKNDTENIIRYNQENIKDNKIKKRFFWNLLKQNE